MVIISPLVTDRSAQIIILSPHFDDAVLSLGGLIAKEKEKIIVATFFTDKPKNKITTYWDTISGFHNSDQAISDRIMENYNALMPFNVEIVNFGFLDNQYRDNKDNFELKEKIVLDIEKIIDNLPNKDISIYGPSYFGEIITHPDHKLLHDVFIEVAKNRNSDTSLNFFLYEDFPYVERFRKEYGNIIPLSENEIRAKIHAIGQYTSQVKAFKELNDNILRLAEHFTRTRCPRLPAEYKGCEVVHKIHP
ncbi:MAG: PIG-L family deacetylase [Patescibacteria group bacterium]